jgi:predicted dithiol-disulfide oxidoreductase (DUF899 family)
VDHWEQARQELLAQEAEFTHARRALTCPRSSARITKDYTLAGRDGRASLRDLFAGRRTLVVYHFLVDPVAEADCVGCSFAVDNIGHPAQLNAPDATLVVVSRAPLEAVGSYRNRMAWWVPWYSSAGTAFNRDFGADSGFHHALSVFVRAGDDVLQTYSTFDVVEAVA